MVEDMVGVGWTMDDVDVSGEIKWWAVWRALTDQTVTGFAEAKTASLLLGSRHEEHSDSSGTCILWVGPICLISLWFGFDWNCFTALGISNLTCRSCSRCSRSRHQVVSRWGVTCVTGEIQRAPQSVGYVKTLGSCGHSLGARSFGWAQQSSSRLPVEYDETSRALTWHDSPCCRNDMLTHGHILEMDNMARLWVARYWPFGGGGRRQLLVACNCFPSSGPTLEQWQPDSKLNCMTCWH